MRDGRLVGSRPIVLAFGAGELGCRAADRSLICLQSPVVVNCSLTLGRSTGCGIDIKGGRPGSLLDKERPTVDLTAASDSWRKIPFAPASQRSVLDGTRGNKGFLQRNRRVDSLHFGHSGCRDRAIRGLHLEWLLNISPNLCMPIVLKNMAGLIPLERTRTAIAQHGDGPCIQTSRL